MELQKIFGANVRHFRHTQSWTQEKLADRVGVTYETIGKIERGAAAPTFATTERIGKALGIHPLALFNIDTQLSGERGRLLSDIQSMISRMNDEQLSRAGKMLKAFMGQ